MGQDFKHWEEFTLYDEDPFDEDLASPMEVMFQEAHSDLDEETQPESEEETAMGKVPVQRIEELANVYFGMQRTGVLAERVPVLKRVWYDFDNDCPHLTFVLRYPFEEDTLTLRMLEETRIDVESLGDVLAPLFGKRIALSFEMC